MVNQILQSSVAVNMEFMFLCLFVFTGEALHVAHLMAAHGYFFPIDDHMLTVKNDNTFYRFQVSWIPACRRILYLHGTEHVDCDLLGYNSRYSGGFQRNLLPPLFVLKMEIVCSSETKVIVYQS